MATDTGEKTPRLGEFWQLCARCDHQFPLNQLLEQKGFLVCKNCYDLEDHEDEVNQ